MPNPADFDLRESDGYLSRHRGYLNAMQRERRKSNRRIDYFPSPEALRVIERKMGRFRGSITGLIDALVIAGDGELPE